MASPLITPPAAVRGTAEQQTQQLYSYLFNLSEKLNMALQQVDTAAAPAAAAVPSAGAAKTDETYNTLRALIVKTADTVEQEIVDLGDRVTSTYVAKSEYGTYTEAVDRRINDTIRNTDTRFSMVTEAIASAEMRLEGELAEYMTAVNGRIIQGIIEDPERGDVVGIAIGQDLKIGADGVIDKRQNMAFYTADELSFWVNGVKAAWFSQERLHVTGIEVNDSIVMGGKWQLNWRKGLTLKWIGGGD